jgi:hypothetical protein
LNGTLRWGIELLVNGDGMGEYISKFTPPNGKYVALDVREYAVVDFRNGRPMNISRHPKRITMFSTTMTIQLRNVFLGWIIPLLIHLSD